MIQTALHKYKEAAGKLQTAAARVKVLATRAEVRYFLCAMVKFIIALFVRNSVFFFFWFFFSD
jgi:hypothetical protein